MSQITTQNYLRHVKFVLITTEIKMKVAKEVSTKKNSKWKRFWKTTTCLNQKVISRTRYEIKKTILYFNIIYTL